MDRKDERAATVGPQGLRRDPTVERFCVRERPPPLYSVLVALGQPCRTPLTTIMERIQAYLLIALHTSSSPVVASDRMGEAVRCIRRRSGARKGEAKQTPAEGGR